MSVWQFFSALNGYIDANTPRERGKISSETEAEELFAWTLQGTRRAEIEASTWLYELDGLSLRKLEIISFVIPN